MSGTAMPDDVFAADPVARRLAAAVSGAMESLADVSVDVTRSQVGFRRRHPFAAIWRPGQYLRGEVAPLVLTVYLPVRDPSPRWKEIVEPAPGRFTHHLELRDPADVDDEVAAWLRTAWVAAA